jgi:hypothetical protein
MGGIMRGDWNSGGIFFQFENFSFSEFVAESKKKKYLFFFVFFLFFF